MPITLTVLQDTRDSLGNAIKTDSLENAIKALKLYETHVALNPKDRHKGEEILNACLRDAIGKARSQIALALIDAGSVPSLHDNLAIRLASSRGLFNIIPKLVEKGADPSVAGYLPLQLAAGSLDKSQQMLETVKCLIKEIDRKISNQEDSYLHKATAATTAYWKGNTPIAQTILESMDSKSLKKLSKDPDNENTAIISMIKPILRKRIETIIQKTNCDSKTIEI